MNPAPPSSPGVLARIGRSLATAWDSLEDFFGRAERRTRRLEAEVRQLGLDLLDKVDDLPFVPTLVPMPPVTNQFYGHGAFMGAAPGLLADKRWRRILAFLMPDVYLEVEDAVARDPAPGAIIPMFENNPVMCAFGAWMGAERRAGLDATHPNDLAGVEWDVFVDSALVDGFSRAEGDAARAAIVARIADTMVIAHASTADTVQEAAGVCQYEDVRRTPKTGLGGVEAAAWLDLFGRALLLAGAPDLGAAIAEMSKLPRHTTGEACSLHTFLQPLSAAEALAPWRALTGRDDFSIVLEMKSRASTPALLRALVEELNRRGLHVTAVCSFDPAEVEGVGAAPQQVAGRSYPGPREVRFFHWAGDVQLACERGAIAQGQSLLFNGASLLERVEADASGEAPPQRPYAWQVEVIADLDAYRRRHDLQIGIYVQEGDCDDAAAHALSELVQRYPATFELGFAWGGLLDEVHLRHDGTDRRGLGSQAMLRYVSSRPWRLGPPEDPPADGDEAPPRAPAR